MPRTVGLGAGGHARVVLDILSYDDNCEVVGLLDPDPDLWGKDVLGVPILGDDSLLPKLHNDGVCHAFLGLGHVADSQSRRALYEKLLAQGFEPLSAIHPASVVAESASLKRGVTLMAGALIGPCACLGENVIVNTGAIIEHDCRIEAHAHVAPGARLAGNVRVARGALVGIGATVVQGTSIGEEAVVGAGAVVLKDVPNGVVVAGVPAKIIRNVVQP